MEEVMNSPLILDGKKVSEKIRRELRSEISEASKEAGREPGLAVILVGTDPASEIYVRNKIKACDKVGIRSFSYRLAEGIRTEEIIELVSDLNAKEEVDGILIQLPLPTHIDQKEVISAINPAKDVDGFHPENMGRLLGGIEEGFVPCTPLGIDILLSEYGIDLKGMDVTVVGAGFIVGRPLSALLLRRNATVTVCHIHTRDLAKFTSQADIVISATGVPHLIKGDMVREGAVVIDVGISRIGGKIVGDVEFESVSKKASAITPVPGGVGPMTVTALLMNTFKAFKMRTGIQSTSTMNP